MRHAKFAILIVVILALGVTNVWAPVTPTRHFFAAMLAGIFNLGAPGASIQAVDEGFVINLGNFADSGTLATPVMFPASATGVNAAYNGLNPDEWTLAFLLTAQAGTPPSTTFAVHFKLTTAVGTGDQDRTIYVATSATVTPGSSVLADFGVGPTLQDQFTYVLTVQQV